MTLLIEPAAHRRAEEGYARPVRVLHWLTAALLLLLMTSGYAMVNWMPDDSAAQEALYDVHKSIGVTLLGVLALRIGARVAFGAPPLPPQIAGRGRLAAGLGHLGLYGLTLLAALAGWALTDFGGHGVVWFGLPMPQVFPVRETLFGVPTDPTASVVHEWLAWGLVALVAVHLIAVVHHRRRHGVNLLDRMRLGRR